MPPTPPSPDCSHPRRQTPSSPNPVSLDPSSTPAAAPNHRRSRLPRRIHRPQVLPSPSAPALPQPSRHLLQDGQRAATGTDRRSSGLSCAPPLFLAVPNHRRLRPSLPDPPPPTRRHGDWPPPLRTELHPAAPLGRDEAKETRNGRGMWWGMAGWLLEKRREKQRWCGVAILSTHFGQ
uniref:Uncharacterized protein n=1 Tax=Setaria viridis TaxID=4556 RepID=A0A4V6D3W7_SETVI|nr:hypothetical protein SEVIR_7G091500v2 [Setaria viridis]